MISPALVTESRLIKVELHINLYNNLNESAEAIDSNSEIVVCLWVSGSEDSEFT